jgi:chromosome segregation ATPase
LNVIENLNHVINTAEDDMGRLRSRYEAVLRQRNAAGMRLLDRNDELCILHEKANVQSAILEKGETEIRELEESLRRYNLAYSEFKRKVELEKGEKPKVTKLEEEMIGLQQQLTTLQSKTSELSSVMGKPTDSYSACLCSNPCQESPNDRSRCRNLPGKDPTQTDLLHKLKYLEERLAEREVC